ncbi:hypothetical protein CDL15_Pgr002022 [Punica granatum]|uniref:Uncharacterized protein n=1 Tax=Punica granatum TaxID=22663 RepID=A0A218XCE4_PUNGR|nr:hypothetical protein CDL15_Pgr002022 [Punica granatum]PKI48553.1 hypothetical protein CRG98_031074 [Punica granatum]
MKFTAPPPADWHQSDLGTSIKSSSLSLRANEQWKSSGPKRRERSDNDEEQCGHSEKRQKRGGKKRKERGSKSWYEPEETEADTVDDQEYLEDEDANLNYREGPANETQEKDKDDEEENTQDLLAAAGIEDSDADDEVTICLIQKISYSSARAT